MRHHNHHSDPADQHGDDQFDHDFNNPPFGRHFGEHLGEHFRQHAGEHHGERQVPPFGFGRHHGGRPHGAPFGDPRAQGGPPFPPFPGFPPGGGRGFPGGFGFGPPSPEGFGRGHGHGHSRGHGGPRGEHRGGRGGRARRGNVRAAILTLLAEDPMHGYEMIKEISERSGGFWRPSPGSVYPTLQLLADEGLVSADEGTSGKRLYALTEEGRTEAAKLDGAPPWEQAANDMDPNEADLRSAMGLLATAAWQVSQAATSGQKARAVKALTEARQAMYLILAESGVETDDEPEDTAETTD